MDNQLQESHRFHWVDHVLFSLTLLISACIGIYYGFFNKQHTSKDLLLGSRRMQILPVTLSILASFMSAVSVLGTPAEIYNFGTIYFMLCTSYFISFPLTAHVYLPIYHNLQLTSAHEYLERRFNPCIRYMVSVIFILQMLFYMAIVIYAPALAFSQVSGLSMLVSILAVGAVCTFYTALGGLKAVMWTDVVQMIIAYGAMLGVIIQGSIVVGGFDNVWRINKQHGRIKFLDFNADPLERHTLWTLFVGGSATTLTVYASNQTMIQRYLSMQHLHQAQRSIYFALVATIVFLLMLCMMGLVMFAYYAECDPVTAGIVTRSDQILALYMLEIFQDLPGLPGLFLACVFSAALSTVSSGLNSLATVFLEDLVKPLHRRFSPIPFPDRKATHISRVLAVILGVVTILLAFMARYMPSTLVQISLSIFGMVGGPILAVFSVGILFPHVNSWGAGVGFLTSLFVAFSLGIGAILAKNPLPTLPMSTENCTNQASNITYNTTSFTTTMTTTDMIMTSSTVPTPTYHGPAIFRISYLYYSLAALITCFTVAPIISCLTGCNRKEPVKKHLLYPVYDRVVAPLLRMICCCKHRMWTYDVYPMQHGNGESAVEEMSLTDHSSAASLVRREQHSSIPMTS